ncbi:unnamed protein product [Lactuca saligna]|uniref:Uncharacterized protein n=1 Tax=Lactuca saligna TaxID=75948 RepID=A0AA35YVT8_LACSI|nr:unnamed protein product [Lactuca saligna]
MSLCGLYRGKICHQELYLVETLPPTVSKKCIHELAGLLPAERGNVGSSGLALSSQSAVGATFPAHSSASASADILVASQARKLLLLSEKNEVCVFIAVLGDGFDMAERKVAVVPTSSETLPSLFVDSLTADLGACSVLGGAMGVLRGFPSSDTPYMVEKIRTSSHTLASEAYVPGWAVTKDSLLSKDIAAQEWS